MNKLLSKCILTQYATHGLVHIESNLYLVYCYLILIAVFVESFRNTLVAEYGLDWGSNMVLIGGC